MTFYGIINGPGKESETFILQCLRDERLLDIPRYRDSWIEKLGNQLVFVIFTRTGGDNRENYEEQNKAMTKHPLYFSDVDDDFDETYAKWYFKIPEKYLAEATRIFEKQEPVKSLEEKTTEMVDKIKGMKPDEVRKKFPEMAKVVDEVAEFAKKAE